MIILSDMDGVICDFEGGVYNAMRDDKTALYHGWYIEPLDRRNMKIEDQYKNAFGEDCIPILRKITCDHGFFRTLEPIPGAREALYKIAESHEVMICTSNLLSNPTCSSDKFWWIEKYLGEPWIHRMIIAKDKTLVYGDYLIDDRPTIPGRITPYWEQILFKQPHNQGSPVKKVIRNWDEIFGIIPL